MTGEILAEEYGYLDAKHGMGYHPRSCGSEGLPERLL